MKLTKGASAATQKYMVDGIRYVCENFKERSPGSHSERKAQKYLNFNSSVCLRPWKKQQL